MFKGNVTIGVLESLFTPNSFKQKGNMKSILIIVLVSNIYTVDCFHKGCNYCMNMNRKIKTEESKKKNDFGYYMKKQNNIENVALYLQIQWSCRSEKGISLINRKFFKIFQGDVFFFLSDFKSSIYTCNIKSFLLMHALIYDTK